MERDIEAGRRYTVYTELGTEGLEWADAPEGGDSIFGMGTILAFAVRVLAVQGSFVFAVGAQGETLSIPLRSFGGRIPDAEFTTGQPILIDESRYYVERATDRPAEAYYVRRQGASRGAPLVRLSDGGWAFGAGARRVEVRK